MQKKILAVIILSGVNLFGTTHNKMNQFHRQIRTLPLSQPQAKLFQSSSPKKLKIEKDLSTSTIASVAVSALFAKQSRK